MKHVLIFLFVTAFAAAHDPGVSNATVELGGTRIRILMRFAWTDLDSIGEPSLERLAARAVEWRAGASVIHPDVVSVKRVDANSVEFTLDLERMSGTFHSTLLPEMPLGHRQILVLRDFNEAAYRIQMLSAKNANETISEADLAKTSPPLDAPKSGTKMQPHFILAALLILLSPFLFLFRRSQTHCGVKLTRPACPV